MHIHPQAVRCTTTDQELAATQDYQTVMEEISTLYQSGILTRGGGYCLSMSEIIRTLLQNRGIQSHLAECKLTVMSQFPPRLSLVGHDHLTDATAPQFNQMDVHVVCITDTEIPMLIDLSIAGFRPEHTPYICERVGATQLGQYQWSDTTWDYQIKPLSQIPRMHQQSIIDRYATDRKIFGQLRTMKLMLLTTIAVGTITAVGMLYNVYQLIKPPL